MPPATTGAPLSAVEQVLYKAASDAEILYQRDVMAACPGYTSQELQDALNALIKKHLVKLLKDSDGKACFKAVNVSTARQLGALEGDEGMVYSHIQNSGNQGIWTKTLKAKTNLHQTVITRCLKQLEQKQLVKTVKSVKYPARKICMLFNVTPSVELTGGPWYNENELDVGFIDDLCASIYTLLKKRTWPSDTDQVWPTSRSGRYPNVREIQQIIAKSGVTPVKLEEEHVQMLVDVLVYDGKVECLPGTSGFGDWEDGGGEGESADERRRRRHKRKRDGSDEEDEEERGRKRSRRSKGSDDDRSGDDDEDDEAYERRKKRGKRKASPAGSDSDGSDHSRSHPKKRRKSRHSSPSGSSAGGGSPKPVSFTALSAERFIGGGSVYRAIKREGVPLGFTQAPCGRCEVFDFCKEGGPVNPRGCEYYDGWLEARLADEDEGEPGAGEREERGKKGKGRADGDEEPGEEEGEEEDEWAEGETMEEGYEIALEG